MPSGKVKSWRKVYGFAEMEDGTMVWIHQSELDGGSLRVGLGVEFDTEDVEGHEGKKKGTNVKGPAVLAKGATLGEEELEADKKLIAEMKEARDAENKKAFDPVFEKVSGLSRANKVALIKQLATDLTLTDRLSFKNSDDQRADPTSRGKQKYTRAEFIAFYGKRDGDMMWNTAGRRRVGGRRPTEKSE